MNLRFTRARPERAAPRSNTVVPPSGTELKDRLSVKVTTPSDGGSWVEKAPENEVASKPFPLTVPKIATLRNSVPPTFDSDSAEVSKLNVKPPTCQKLAKPGSDVLNVQGAASVTCVPWGMPPLNVAKVPDSVPTVLVPQETTLEAETTEPVLRTAVPEKPMLPVIGTALTVCVMATATIAATASLMIFFILVFVVCLRYFLELTKHCQCQPYFDCLKNSVKGLP